MPGPALELFVWAHRAAGPGLLGLINSEDRIKDPNATDKSCSKAYETK